MNHRHGGKDFMAMHRHGFVRVATSTPRVRPADVSFNRDAILEEARRADAAGRRPGGLSRALRLLLRHRRPPPAGRAPRRGRRPRSATSPRRAPIWRRSSWSARRCAQRAGSTTARWRSRAAGCSASCRRASCPTTASTTRSAGSPPAASVAGLTIRVAGQEVPFGTDLIFEASDLAGFVFHVEICEDFWAAVPPSTPGALAGATILANLSASNITIGKADERHLLCRSQSARAVAAYVYSAAGPGESTTDLAWDGQGVIYELGDLLAEIRALPAGAAALHRRRRHRPHPRRADADADLQRHGRGGRRSAPPVPPHPLRAPADASPTSASIRPIRRFPYVPEPHDASRPGLLRGLQHPGARACAGASRRPSGKHMVIGVSGGLDSTHALIVAAKVCDRLGLPRTHHPRLHHAGLRHRRGDQGQRLEADERARRHRRGDRHPPGGAADARATWATPSPRASRSTTSPSRTCRRASAPTISSASPTSAAASSSAPATSPSWRSAGAPTASATR